MASDTNRGQAVTIPELALVVIAGDAHATEAFAARWFSTEEVARPGASPTDPVRTLTGKRLADGLLAVALLSGNEVETALSLARLARSHDVTPIALTLIGGQSRLGHLPTGPHGFSAAYEITPQTPLTRVPLACDHREERAPFDIVGDVHGCYEELVELLEALGYVADARSGMRPPADRRLVFVGDLVDRGPGIVATVRLALRMVAAGVAFCVPGNHDDKLARALKGHNVWVAHGLRDSLEQIDRLPGGEGDALAAEYLAFMRELPPYLVLDGGALVVAHAGLPERFHGRVSGRIRSLVLYGETLGEDSDGLPIRVDWAEDYRGAAAVVYGHTPQREAAWRNNTINCDTGCVFGGKLTAIRWPEREIVSVPARKEYAHRPRPL